MTSQKDIQSLIADIDSILPRADVRLPWSKPGDVAKERRVLERVRSYLVSQQQNFTVAGKQSTSPNSAPAEVAQQMAQAVTQEINALRAELVQPLLADVDALRNEREFLVREIRQLEGVKQQLDSFPQQKIVQQQVISELSQELLSRCTESLTQQLGQIIANLEARRMSTESITGVINPTTSNWGKIDSAMQSPERQEQRRHMEVQSDQMLLALDANQQAIFEALQRNLQSYQESLSQGLEKMHSLGVQGEMLFTALVDRLVEQLGREDASGQLADSLRQTGLATSSPTTLEPPLTKQESGMSSAEAQEAIGNTTAIPPTSSTVGGAVPQELEVATPETSDENSFLQNLNSEDWEIIEGLDFENLGIDPENSDGLDTFIQLDIDTQASLPSLDEPDTAAAELILSSDSRRKDIEDLYQTLFGTDSLTDTAKLDESSISTPELPTAMPVDAQSEALQPPEAPTSFPIPTDDPVNPQFSKVEDVLFEGLADPAAESSQAQPLDWSAEDFPESWAELFAEDRLTDSSSEADLAGEAQAPSLGSSESDRIPTIAALTDLFEEMGLSYNPSVPEDNSMPATANQQTDYQPSETNPQRGSVEENYIPASPEEDLLAIDELESDPTREIRLDQNTLQQLQRDLYSFEGSENQQLPRQPEQRSLANDFESPTVEPDAAQGNQQNQWLRISEELLAEDWEEVMHNYSSNDSTPQSLTNATTSDQEPEQFNASAEEVTTASGDDEISDHSTRTAPESVESDFEPELFPSEALELDQENALSLSATPLEELTTSKDPHALEDEMFIEMQWDEPIDGTTEERITSPELEFHWDSSSQATVDREQEDTLSESMPQGQLAPNHEALGEKVQDESRDIIPDTPLPPQTWENESDIDRKDVAQPEASNPDRPENPEKSNHDSDSEANR